VTKHHAAILSTAAPRIAARNEDLQEQVDLGYGRVPPLCENYDGACTIETYSIAYTPKGVPDRGVVIGRTPQGNRVLARVIDAAALAFLTDASRESIGQSGFVQDGRDGLMHFSLEPKSPAGELPLLFDQPSRHVAVVTLNQPDRRNVINGAVTRLMVDYLTRIESDPDIRVVILTAAGDVCFCGGADLSEVSLGHAADLTAGGNGFAGFVNAQRGKPWIAAIRGAAVGGGTEIALACDLVVAGESATFGLPEVKRGLLAAAGGVYRLPRSIPPRKAMELVLTGATISAREAEALHLVNRVTADDGVMAEAMTLAEAIARNAPLAVSESRKLVNAAFDKADPVLSERGLAAIGALMNGEDAREGIRAFLQKRAPDWKGR
jgi:enoyl-CoA hydratase/carnithine racemase